MTSREAPSTLARLAAQYRERALLYHDYCSSLRNLLVSLLDTSGLKYQMSWRIKSLESIREKVARNAARGKRYRNLADIEDLAGIRVVFYLESDKRRFLSALYRELTRDRLQVEEHRKDRGYRATHVLVRLGAKRLALNEYRRFARLKCELQLTSALYHAWSEIEHDILYKRGLERAADRVAAGRFRDALDRAMVDHIEPATEILEEVARRARRKWIGVGRPRRAPSSPR